MTSPSSRKLRTIELPSENSRKLKILTVACLAFICLDGESIYSQSFSEADSSNENKINKENTLESVMSYSDDVSEIFTKIDLNTASSEDLILIPGMTSELASSIVAYRRRVKFIYNFDELSILDGATPEVLLSLRDHAEILPEENFTVSASSYASFAPQKTRLYQDAYQDDGIKNFQKLHIDYRNFELNAVTDKDAGENSYLDYYSLSLSIKRVSIFSVIDLGNYSVSLGNGMLFSNAGTISKSAGPISPLFIKCAYSLRPYRSRSESGYLRGQHLPSRLGNLNLPDSCRAKISLLT